MNKTIDRELKSFHFNFGLEDHLMVAITIGISGMIGIFYGCYSKRIVTTAEYLLGDRKMAPIPIGISMLCSQLSGTTIMSVPAEIYSFGFAYSLAAPSLLVVFIVLCYVIVPVFYNNNITNCYQYLELRFDKKTKKLATLLYVMLMCLLTPIMMFVSAIAFSQATGINVHLINGVVSAICIFYTTLGGIKAVVWADVARGIIMFVSISIITSSGLYKVGGIREVFQKAEEGGRLNMFNFSTDLSSRTTFWNCFLSGIVLWIGNIGVNQSCVQKIVTLPSLKQAKISLLIFLLSFAIVMFNSCFTGLIMFTRYYNCDPIRAGIVEKADKLMPFFVQDIVGHLKGMPGVFVACVLSGTLSLMAANFNSLSGVVYFDYIKPFIHHTEESANSIIKCLVVAIGVYCFLVGILVENFTSILQMLVTINGVLKGVVVGMFLLGMLYPKANSKAVFWSAIVTITSISWIMIKAQMDIHRGELRYEPLPTKTDDCKVFNFSLSSFNQTFASTEEGSFSIYKISFYWYGPLGTLLICLFGVILSHLTHSNRTEKFDIGLIASVAHFLIPEKWKRTQIVHTQAQDIKSTIVLDRLLET